MNNRSLAILIATMHPDDLAEYTADPEPVRAAASPPMVIEIEAPDFAPIPPVDYDAGRSQHEWQRMQKRQRFANRGRR